MKVGTDAEVLDFALSVRREGAFEIDEALNIAEDEVKWDLGDDIFGVFVSLAVENDEAVVGSAETRALRARLVEFRITAIVDLVPAFDHDHVLRLHTFVAVAVVLAAIEVASWQDILPNLVADLVWKGQQRAMRL